MNKQMENPGKDDRSGKSEHQSDKTGKGNNSHSGSHSGKDSGKSQQSEKSKEGTGKVGNKVK